MDTRHLKLLLDTCFLAKRITETLPQLPEHMKPRHIHVLDVVYEFQKNSGQEIGCRVSDVSSRLGITTPSVTKLVGELQQLGMLEKYADASDGRVTRLRLTGAGMDCVDRHVLSFHGRWTDKLHDITNEQVEGVVHVIRRLRETMPEEE